MTTQTGCKPITVRETLCETSTKNATDIKTQDGTETWNGKVVERTPEYAGVTECDQTPV